MRETANDNLLRSWKEIAAYLECTVRTCHRWEHQRGMPIHRAEAAETKSPVFAYKDELDAWFKETFRTANGSEKKAEGIRPWLKWAVGGAGILFLAGAAFFIERLMARGVPADFDIDGSVLVILDKQKRELGRFDTGLEDLMPESFFRTKFQSLNQEVGSPFPCIAIKDLDGDGDREVLFAPRTSAAQMGLGRLYCLDHKGDEVWTFDAGREIRCPDKIYSPDYRAVGFVCHDLDRDGRLETLLFAYQKPDWPCQMAVLDSSGKRVGEYWNAGQLTYPVFHDLDGDGREELIVVGVNNEYRGGCLIVFDTRRISGSSPQSGRFACEGFEPGSERYYVTVPYTDVSAAMGHVVEGFTYVFITGNDRISATYGPGLFYEFSFDLEPLQVYLGHGYERSHDEARKAGRLSSVLGDPYLAALADGVRWWNGSEMVPEPAKNPR